MPGHARWLEILWQPAGRGEENFGTVLEKDGAWAALLYGHMENMGRQYSMMGASSEVSTADNFLYTDLYMCVQVKTTKNVYYYPIMVYLALWITSYNYRLSRTGLASENLIPGPIRLLWHPGHRYI